MQEIDSIINIEEEIDKQISDKYLPNYNNITNNITNNMNNELIDDNDKEEVELTVKDVFESHSEYIVDQIKVRIQKHNDILFYSIGTANAMNGELIPSTIWTDIGILKEEYRPKTIINAYGTTGDSSSCSWIRIMPDGTMSVYQNSNRAQQCTACFCYPISDKTQVMELTVRDVFESYNKYVKDSKKVIIQKYDDILFYTFNTGNGTTTGECVPSGIWTDIGVLKKEYRPKTTIEAHGNNGGVNCNAMIKIMPDGTMSTYQNSNSVQQCAAYFCYPISDKTEVKELTVKDVFESYNKYIKDTKKIILQKYNNILFYTFRTGNSTNGEPVPSGEWVDIGILKSEYRPKKLIQFYGTTGGVTSCVYMRVNLNGEVSAYQLSGSKQQCGATLYYPVY